MPLLSAILGASLLWRAIKFVTASGEDSRLIVDEEGTSEKKRQFSPNVHAW